MNLGQQDYQLLTTLFQENLKESGEHFVQPGKFSLWRAVSRQFQKF